MSTWEPDQPGHDRFRLARFRRDHPGAVIDDLGFGGAWQARIPRPAGGEIVITRYAMEGLADALDEMFPPGSG